MAQKNNIQFSIDFKKGDTKALQELKNELNEIQQAASRNDFNTTVDEINKIVTAARTLESALNQAFDVNLNAINVQKFNQVLKQSGMSAETLYRDLSMAGEAGQQAFLKMSGQLMQFNTAIKQSNAFLNGLATTFFNTIKQSAMSSIVNNISGTIQKSFYYIKDLDRGLNDIRIVTGKSADEMERFAVTANDAAKALSVSTEDFTKGALIYYQQGLDDETATQLAEITAKTANVTGQGMDAVSEELTAVQNGYQVANRAAEEGMQVYEEYVDKMAAVGATTASDLEELSVAMSKVASAAAAMGVDFDDLNAQIATIVSVTRQAPESVGTALKTIYARLGDLKIDGVDEFGVKLGEVSQQLQDVGINVLDQEGNLRDMSDVIKEVASAWGGWTEAQRQAAAVAMAGKRQYNNLIALFDNWDMHEKALATSMGAVGTLSQQQAIAAESLAKKMEKMSATAEDLYGNLFDEDSLIGLVEIGTEALQLLADFTESVGGLKNLLPMIGSIGLQVFNEQIGRGLANIVVNAQTANREIITMKESQQALQSIFSNSNFVSGTGTNTEALKENVEELYSYYQQMVPYQSIMTKEQKEQYNNILNMKVAAGDLAISLEKQAEYYAANTKYMKYINSDIVKSLDDTTAVTNELNKQNQIIDAIEKNIYASGDGDPINAIRTELEIISKDLDLDKNTIDQIIARINSAAKATNDVDEGAQQVANDLKGIRDRLSEMAAQKSKIASLQESAKTLGINLHDAAAAAKNFSQITQTLGAIGQFASSLNTLYHITDIVNNNDLSTGEKFIQILTSASFAAMNLIPSLGKIKNAIFALNTQENANIAIKKAGIAADKLKEANLAAEIAKKEYLNKVEEKNTAINISNAEAIELQKAVTKAGLAADMAAVAAKEADTKTLIANNSAAVQNILASEGNVFAKIKVMGAVLLHKKAVDAETAALVKQKAVALGVGGVFGILATVLVAVTAAYKAQHKAITENAKAELEKTKAIQDEIDANTKLYNEYKETVDAYEKGTSSKEELLKATEAICDAYDIEINKLDLINDKYNTISKSIDEVRKKELEEAQRNLANQLENQRLSAFGNISGGDIGGMSLTSQSLDNKTLDINFGAGNTIGETVSKAMTTGQDADLMVANDAVTKAANQYLSKFGSYGWYQVAQGDENELKEFYEGLIKTKEDFLHTSEVLADQMGIDAATLRAQTQEYQTLLQIINMIEPEVKGFDETAEKIKENNILTAAYDLDMSNIKTLSEYRNIVASIADEYGYTTEEVEKYLGSINHLTEEYQNEEDILSGIAKKTGIALEEIQNWQDGLSDDKKKLVLTGQVDFEFADTFEQIDKEFELASKKYQTYNVSGISSLTSTLSSGGKLTKDDKDTLKELSGENPYVMAGLDDKSVLHQLDTIDEITQYRIQKNEEYLQNVKEISKEELAIRQEELEGKKDAALEAQALLEQYNNGQIDLDEEEKERLTGIVDEYVLLTIQVEKLQKLSEEGLGFEEIENIGFTDLITDLDLVSDKLDAVRSAAELIGEGFTVAASDVEKFSNMFPEMLEGMEILSDGSMKLSEETVKNNIEGIKAELEARTQAKIEEVDQQIQLKELEQQFLQEQRQNPLI